MKNAVGVNQPAVAQHDAHLPPEHGQLVEGRYAACSRPVHYRKGAVLAKLTPAKEVIEQGWDTVRLQASIEHPGHCRA